MNLSKNNLKSGATIVASLFCFSTVAISQNLFPKEGFWMGSIYLQGDSIELPLHFETRASAKSVDVYFLNASEKLKSDSVFVRNDSLIIRMAVFDSEFRAQLNKDRSSVKGVWINNSRKTNNVLPFSAMLMAAPADCYTGGKAIHSDTLGSRLSQWEATFSANTAEETKAKGLFYEKENGCMYGTFRTETGDYRYLGGMKNNTGEFRLSAFDGSHAFLFTGVMRKDSIVNGQFYSGAHWQEPWGALRNEKFELRSPDSLTFLKPGYSKIDFNFKNLDGKIVALSDDRFKGKVVIVQLMGSWCPNCMDETRFLAAFYDKHKKEGLEVIALAFERTDNFEKAVSNVKRSKERFKANYEFLITEKTGKDQASLALPMLNQVMAFPTTIYIDKKGAVRKIYTGFNGPATGNAYVKFAEETEQFIQKLLAE